MRKNEQPTSSTNNFTGTSRRIIISLLLLFCVFATSLFSANRVVLFEEIMNIGCSHCWDATAPIDTFLDSTYYDSHLAVVRYHAGGPGSDPVYQANPTEQTARINFYDITGVPHLRMDGPRTYTPTAYLINDYKQKIAVPTNLDIFVSKEGDETSGTIHVRLIAEGEINADAALRFFCMVVEDNVPAGGTSWPASYLHQCFRDNLVSSTGDPVSFSSPYPDTLEVDMPYNLSAWNYNNLYLATFVQEYGSSETTKDIINASWKKFDEMYDVDYPPPVDLSADLASASSVALSWSAPEDPSTSPNSYKIYRRKPTSSAPFTNIGSSSSRTYTDNTAEELTTYRYAVAAVYGSHESVLSSKIDVVTEGSGVLDTVVLGAGPGSATLAGYMLTSVVTEGGMADVRLVPENLSYDYKIVNVSFTLYNEEAGVSSQDVRINLYDVDTSLTPGDLLAQTDVISITRFHEDWATVDVSALNVYIPSADGIHVAVEYMSGPVASVGLDNTDNIDSDISFFYYSETWLEHYSLFAEPEGTGYNMIRASFERSSADLDEQNTTKKYLPDFSIDRIVPNPFHQSCNIKLTVSKPQHVETKVYSTDGRLIKNLAEQFYSEGEFYLNWNGENDQGQSVPSGVYLIQSEGSDANFTNKVILLH